MAVRNSEVAKIFDRVGAILEIQEENPFRVRAYHNAARTIEGLSKPVAKMLEEGEDLSELRGIGKDLAKKSRKLSGPALFSYLRNSKRKVVGVSSLN